MSPFPQEPTKTPTSIGKITLNLSDLDGTAEGRKYTYKIEIVCSDASKGYQRGNLKPQLLPSERADLVAILNAVRARAGSEIIPP